MRKCQLILVITLILVQHCFAQQNYIWYFGARAGIDFTPTTSSTAPLALGNSVMVADEGCSSICDSSGKLLFYSNGTTVYNRVHQIMLNGDGLKGNISAVQSCIIVPMPGNDSIFYLFTTDAIENNYADGYCYSIINMKHDNGKGEVISRNNPLWAPSTERMTASRHANGVDVWLITNDNTSNTFRSWLIDCNGLQTTPVISVAGVVMDQHELENSGAMKVSPDGKMLCQTHFPEISVGQPVGNFFQLFDFNNATGMISNGRSIAFPGVRYTNCEFSPDSKLLYMTRPYDSLFEQFEPTLLSTAAISNSRIIITARKSIYGLQLGPDEKIYMSAPGPTLDVINNPNVIGVNCNYQMDQVSLINNARLGFPSFINDLAVDPYNSFSYQVLDSCSGLVQFNGFTSVGGTTIWSWDFGDGNTSTQQSPIHQFTPSNRSYNVKLTITSNAACGRNFIKVRNVLPSGIATTVDFTFSGKCESDSIRFINKTPNAAGGIGVFSWDFGDGTISNGVNPDHLYAGPGIYTVKLKLKTTTPCLDDSITHVLTIAPFTVSVSPSQTILIGNSVTLNAIANNAVYTWSPSTWLTSSSGSRTVATPLDDIVYKVVASNSQGCKAEDSIFIHVLPLDGFYVPSAFTPNNDGKNDVIRPFFGAKFILNDFSIFNRWGQKIFSTSQRGDGWNGKINGNIQETGVYVWIIHAIDKSGVPMERKGSFVLIR